MPDIGSDKQEPVTHNIHCLLIQARNDFVHDRFARALIAGGAQLSRQGDGLKMNCAGIDWRKILQQAAEGLSYVERRHIRIATISKREKFEAALFNVRRLDEWLAGNRSQWLLDLLRRNALVIHFQPLFQQPPGRLHGYECLVRGVGADGELISPARLLDAAEDLDQLAQFDEMCRIAALQAAERAGLAGQRLFINFCPAAIYHPQVCFRTTLDAAKSAGFKPDQITFEAVKRTAPVDRAHEAGIARWLGANGFGFALDNAEASDAAFIAEGNPRPDCVKIDGSLLRRAARTPAEAQALRDLAETARQRGILCIATGVENDPELKCAFNAGIRITQGYFHSPPSPAPVAAAELRDILRRGRQAYARRALKLHAQPHPWDISGLYQGLATLAQTPLRKPA